MKKFWFYFLMIYNCFNITVNIEYISGDWLDTLPWECCGWPYKGKINYIIYSLYLIIIDAVCTILGTRAYKHKNPDAIWIMLIPTACDLLNSLNFHYFVPI